MNLRFGVFAGSVHVGLHHFIVGPELRVLFGQDGGKVLVNVVEVELVPRGIVRRRREGPAGGCVGCGDVFGGLALPGKASHPGGMEGDTFSGEVIAKGSGLRVAQVGEAVVVLAGSGLAVAD